MRACFFLHALDRAEFAFLMDKAREIRCADDVAPVIAAHFRRIGDRDDDRTPRTAFVEALIFLRFFIERGLGHPAEVEFVHARNFLILNDTVQEADGRGFKPLEGPVVFATSRDSWRHAFFQFLAEYFHDRVFLVKPNPDIPDFGRDKLGSLGRIWALRSELVGDVVIPFMRNRHVEQVWQLLEFVRDNIGAKVVLKASQGVEGQKVRALDLSGRDDCLERVASSVKADFLDDTASGTPSLYFTKYYEIETEFRIYYTRDHSGEVTIFSVKNRENQPKDGSSDFAQKDFTTRSFTVTWHYMAPETFGSEHPDVQAAFDQVVALLDAEVGVVEMCRERDGSVRFIELNPLGGALMHQGKDEDLMTQYMLRMWEIAAFRDVNDGVTAEVKIT